jgi:glycosyltransferase involved in cell wall biosynthesis
MRIAIVHYWLLGSRGGERVVEAICRMFPQADIFTLFYDPERVPALIRSRKVHASFLNPLRKFHRSLLPLMPAALESFDLRDYDLVISSESGPAKGVLTPATTAHICYCHTPMRYLWELYPAYRNEFTRGTFRRVLMDVFASHLRTWDVTTANRVNTFLANSRNVRRRIWKTYRRRSSVCYPPVAIENFYGKAPGNYFLMVSELVAYKRLDYAVRLCAAKGHRLKVVGDGPDYRSLKRLAGRTVEFCGRVPESDLRALYAHSAAFIMPGEEDFGMAMVEALASSKPVIGLGRGGAMEIVSEGCGILFSEPTGACLEDALRHFEHVCGQFNPSHLRGRAEEFSETRFETRFLRAVSRYCPQVPKSSAAEVVSGCV